jgi:hypothetical protein
LIDAISESIIARLQARSRAVALNSAGGGAIGTHSAIALSDYKLSAGDPDSCRIIIRDGCANHEQVYTNSDHWFHGKAPIKNDEF